MRKLFVKLLFVLLFLFSKSNLEAQSNLSERGQDSVLTCVFSWIKMQKFDSAELGINLILLDSLKHEISANVLGDCYRAKANILFYKQDYINCLRTDSIAIKYYSKCKPVCSDRKVKSLITMAACYGNLGRNSESLKLSFELKDYFESTKPIDSLKLAKVYTNIGASYAAQYIILEAEVYINKALGIYKLILAPDDWLLGYAYYNASAIELEKRNYEKAELLLLKSENIFSKLGEGFQNYLGRIWHNLALIYQFNHNHDKANVYFFKAKEAWNSLYGEDYSEICRANQNIASNYWIMGDTLKAMQYADLAAAQDRIQRSDARNYIDISSLKSDIYMANHDYEKALELVTCLRDSTLLYYPEDTITWLKAKVLAVDLYYAMGNEQSTLNLLDEILKFEADKFYLKDVFYNCYMRLVEIKSKVRLYAECIGHLNQAEELFAELTLSNDSRVLKLIYTKNEILFKQFTEDYDAKYLKAIVENHNKFCSVANNIRRFTSSVLLTEMKEVFKSETDLSIRVNYLLYKKTDNLEFFYNAISNAENSKCISLQTRIDELDSFKQYNIPDSIVNAYMELITSLRFLYMEANSVEQTDTLYSYYRTQIFNAELNLAHWREFMNLEYPDYFKSNSFFRTMDSSAISNIDWKPDQAVIEYYLAADKLYIFYMDKTKIQFIETDWDEGKSLLFDRYKLSISKDWRDDNNYFKDGFENNAFQLFKVLFPDELQWGKNKKLTIIPDPQFSDVPLESLLVAYPENNVRFKNMHFLLNDVVISYAPSISIWNKMCQPKLNNIDGLNNFCFAPFFSGDTSAYVNEFYSSNILRNELVPLPYSGEEAIKVAKIIKGTYYIDTAATKEQFFKSIHNAKILHIATHGNSDMTRGENSYLLFNSSSVQHSDVMVYARDISRVRIDADLVTLSACEVNNGQYISGEGIISLSWAFIYAGVSSVVASCWKINDSSTKKIMIAFYRNIAKGMDKDEALNEAKKSFIQSNKGLESNPFYWAPFIAIGNMSALR